MTRSEMEKDGGGLFEMVKDRKGRKERPKRRGDGGRSKSQ
jgi:hypothetical protein